MITYKLPRRIRYVPVSAIFAAAFNVPTIGKYDFNGQLKTFYQKLLPTTIYLIDSFSVGGNISTEDFLDAIDTTPALTLRASGTEQTIFEGPFPITGYFSDRQIVHFFKTPHDNIDLIGTMTGTLKQTPALIGVASVSITISISIHAIDESEWEKMFTKKG